MAGVMEIVGEAVRDYMLQTSGTDRRIIALGVASWGFVANNQALISQDVCIVADHLPVDLSRILVQSEQVVLQYPGVSHSALGRVGIYSLTVR